MKEQTSEELLQLCENQLLEVRLQIGIATSKCKEAYSGAFQEAMGRAKEWMEKAIQTREKAQLTALKEQLEP